jgi:hypothetical protein
LAPLVAPARAEERSITYAGQVAPILQKHCQICHRPGQVAPFSLLTYEQARKRAALIAEVADRREMPPWKASTTEGGPFRDPQVLSDVEIAALTAWAQAGAPEGDPRTVPPPPQFAADWVLGKPDLVLTMREPYTVDARGADELRVFVIPSGLTEGRWVSAVDFKPGNRNVVHHMLAAVDGSGRARAKDLADPAPGYKTFGGFGILPSAGLSGWAPGKQPLRLPPGVGRYLPAGADILIQVHYHKSGKVETDASCIGLYFAKGPIDKQVIGAAVRPPRARLSLRPELRIPAGAANHEVRCSGTMPRDVHLTAVVPHMHLLGKDFLMAATRPDGTRRTLIRIDRWDFNWQNSYEFIEPVALPAGTRLDVVAHFDNSAANPRKPNSPPKEIRWGE